MKVTKGFLIFMGLGIGLIAGGFVATSGPIRAIPAGMLAGLILPAIGMLIDYARGT